MISTDMTRMKRRKKMKSKFKTCMALNLWNQPNILIWTLDFWANWVYASTKIGLIDLEVSTAVDSHMVSIGFSAHFCVYTLIRLNNIDYYAPWLLFICKFTWYCQKCTGCHKISQKLPFFIWLIFQPVVQSNSLKTSFDIHSIILPRI